jgi:raffinose/stachyose/melibiose transport system permease protein
MKLTRNERGAMYAFLAPALIMLAAFFLLPVLYVIVVSFFKWNGLTPPSFKGLENYALLFADKAFRRSILNNVIWAFVASCIQVPLALLMALILSRRPKGWKFFRTVYFFPQVISGIALAMLWRGIYNSDYGLLNGLLNVLGLGKYACDWLGGLNTALPSVLIYWIFYIGYYMVIMMADISTIDQAYYEAATIDGATPFQQDLYITIPIIRKTSLLTCVTLASVMGLRQFEQVYMLTNGGPANRTSTLVLFLYKKMQDANYGLSSATGFVLIVVGVIFIVCIRRLLGGRDDESGRARKAAR